MVIAFGRRFYSKNLRKTSGYRDWVVLAILLVIFISGFLLEGTKIISESVFNQMVSDYSDLEEEEEIEPLKVVWAKNYGGGFSGF